MKRLTRSDPNMTSSTPVQVIFGEMKSTSYEVLHLQNINEFTRTANSAIFLWSINKLELESIKLFQLYFVTCGRKFEL